MTVNMGTVWDRTTEFLSENLSALAPIAVLGVFLPHFIGDVANQAVPAFGMAIVRSVGLITVLIGFWGQLAMVALVLDPDAGRGAAQAAATRGYGRSLLVMIAVFVAMAVLATPVMGVMIASGIDVMHLDDGAALPAISPGAGAFLVLYGIVLLIILLAVTVWLVPLYPIILAERLGLAAIGRSFAVTRGITWKLIGVWVLFLVVFGVSAGAARSVFGAVVGLIAPGEGSFTAASIAAALAGAVISTVFSIVVAVFSARLYLAVTRASAGA